MEWLRIVNHWLHLVSVVMFIGGVAFYVQLLTPAARGTLSPEGATPFLTTLAGRFRRFAGILMVLIIFSGAGNIFFRWGEFMDGLPAGSLIILALKLLLAVVIFTLYLTLMVSPLQQAEESRSTPQSMTALLDISYHRFAFVLGILVIFLAGMLRLWS